MADAADQGPVPFTADDFAARRVQAADAAEEAGLAGLLMTPGPDLLYLTGYAPVAITERITMLVIPVRGDPRMIVPKLERPDAENAPGVAGLQLVDWVDGSDAYETTARLLIGTGRYAISDSAWASCIAQICLQLSITRSCCRVTRAPMLPSSSPLTSTGVCKQTFRTCSTLVIISTQTATTTFRPAPRAALGSHLSPGSNRQSREKPQSC